MTPLTEKLKELIDDKLHALVNSRPYCPLSFAINDYHEINVTLQTAGHNTSELHAAIKETLESFVKLKAARDKAMDKFVQQGVLFTVVPIDIEEEQQAPHIQTHPHQPESTQIQS